MSPGILEKVGRVGVNFYAPFGVVGGLGSAARGYLRALEAARVAVSTIPVNEMFVFHAGAGFSPAHSRYPRYPISIVQANADSVRRFLHFRGGSFARARYKIGLWAWELPALRDEWCGEARHFDEIWTASAFSQRAFQAITDKPVVVMPHVVEPIDQPGDDWRHRLKIDPKHFVFLYVFDAASFVTRKNPFCLVDAFQSAFPSDPGVRLVLKVSSVAKNPQFSTYLEDLERRDPRCLAVRDMVEADQLAALFRACNCYVSPHRSEGFGLTVAEAMAYGVPVIATDYSGTVDFVSDDVGYPLGYRLVEIEQGEGPYPQGAIWAEPRRDHLEELMRRIVGDPETAAKKAARARDRILNGYSATAVGSLMRNRLETLV